MRIPTSDRFSLQENQYHRPYHHLLDIEKSRFFDTLDWGLEYYGYVEFVINIAAGLDAKSIAEVGCGDGKILYELAKQFPEKQFFGYDLAEQSIAFAKAYGHSLSNLTFFCDDFKEAEQTFDLILCVETLEHIPNEEIPNFINNFSRRLNTGGKLLVSVPSVNLKLRDKHYRHYDVPLLSEQFSPHFEIEKHWFVHRTQSIYYSVLRFFLLNRFFALNYYPLRRRLMKIYKKHFQIAQENNGLHIIALLTKKHV